MGYRVNSAKMHNDIVYAPSIVVLKFMLSLSHNHTFLDFIDRDVVQRLRLPADVDLERVRARGGERDGGDGGEKLHLLRFQIVFVSNRIRGCSL